MTTQELIERLPIPAADKAQLLTAVAKSGKYKGSLRETKPRENPAAWYALVSTLAPSRVGVSSLMMMMVMDDSEREEFNRIDALIGRLMLVHALNVSEPLMRWNLAAMNWPVSFDRDQFLEQYLETVTKQFENTGA